MSSCICWPIAKSSKKYWLNLALVTQHHSCVRCPTVLPTTQAVEARSLEHKWRERAEAAEAAVEQARTDMADIKADMARQHTSLQVTAGTSICQHWTGC